MLNKKAFMMILVTAVLSLMIFNISSCKKKEPQDRSNKQKDVHKNKKSGDTPMPEIEVKGGVTRNLGKLKEGIKTNVTFTLINKGKADATNISVHDLSKGGCTAVSQVSQLPAGDTTRLEFIFETLGYGGQKETRKIKVRYNNFELSPITLSVTADIQPTEAYQVPIGELYYNFFVLVDIRDEQTFRNGHIAGAVNVPAKDVLSWVSRLPKDFIIYLYSNDNKKSDEIAKILRSNGYHEALSIIGGIEEWKRRYGERVIIEGSK